MRGNRLLAIASILWVAAAGSAFANWTASGTFLYVDREFDQSGFTGAEPAVPIRSATVEVRDFNASGSKALLATGATDDNGNFSIAVSDTKTRTVYVRVLTTSTGVSGLFLRVETVFTPKNPYSVASANVPNHGPNTNVNFGTLTAAISGGGDAFNIYDTGLRSIDYIAARNGSRPGSSNQLTLEWDPLSGNFVSSYDYGAKRIHVGDPSSYNDTVIAHESGHYAFHLNSANDSPGGTHHLTDCNQDLRLAYEEGRATWFGQSVRRQFGLPRPDLYVKTTGAPGPGNLDFYFNVETETPFECSGAASEVSVYSALWDVNDGTATADGSPGVDDENLSRPDNDNWDVDKNYIPTATTKSLEDFWDGWFVRGKGFKSDMTAAFQMTQAEFSPDAGEPNNSSGTALFNAGTGVPIHLTYFSDPDGDGVGAADPDFFSFSASAGIPYTIETLNLWGRANTSLELLASNGSTVLASNDDRAVGDPSSLINYTPSSGGTLYVRSFHGTEFGIYGSYDLKIGGNAIVDNDSDTYYSDVDCNDSNPAVHPGATEVCNGIDDNCVGGIDEGFDGDSDTYTSCGGDCNDADPAVNPGVVEACSNGIDDNCNNLTDAADPACQADTVVITKAEWKTNGKKLTVWATSTAAPSPTLTVVGFGTMTYDSANNRYTLVRNNVNNPGSVTVTSSQGGSDTEPVTVL